MGYSSTGSISSTVLSAGQSVLDILQDPALPKIVGSVRELHEVEQKHPSTSVRTSDGKVPGVGLGKLVTPLEAFVFIRKNPVVGYSLLAGGVFAIMYLGAALFGK